jgi:hypothetical protein
MEERIDKLERSLRRYQLGTGVLALAVLATGLSGWKQGPQDIEARSIKVLGADGKGTLILDSKGVVLVNEKQEPAVSMTFTDGVGAFAVIDSGKPVGIMGGKPGEFNFSVFGKSGTPVASLANDKDLSVLVLGTEDTSRVTLVGGKGGGLATFLDGKQAGVIVATGQPEGNGLIVSDREGKPRIAFSADKDPAMDFLSAKGELEKRITGKQ